ncbi:hypothetical protein GEMRC1_013591 [Eukaryota sp. GEM-RC1]
MSSSRPEWQLVALACQRQGIVITTLYDNVPGVESEYVITDSGLKVLFLDPFRAPSVASINLPSVVDKVVLFSATVLDEEHITTAKRDHPSLFASNSCKWMSMDEFVENAENTPLPPHNVSPDDLVALIYSSGTTGNPKGAMLTNSNIMNSVTGLVERLPKEEVPFQDCLIAFLPPCSCV